MFRGLLFGLCLFLLPTTVQSAHTVIFESHCESRQWTVGNPMKVNGTDDVGIVHFEVYINDRLEHEYVGDPVPAYNAEVPMPAGLTGRNQVRIRAADAAGNYFELHACVTIRAAAAEEGDTSVPSSGVTQ